MRASFLLALLALSSGQEPAADRKDLHGDPLPPGALARMGTARFRHDSLTMSLAYSKDGTRLLSGGYDHTLRIWDVATGRQIALFTGHKDTVTSAVFSPSEEQIISRSRDGTVRLWTIKDGSHRILASDEPGVISCAALSADGSLAACGRGEGRVQVLEVSTGAARKEFKAHEERTSALLFSGDGKTLITAGSDGMIAGWYPSSGEEQWRNRAHSGSITFLARSPNGRTIASASEDKSVTVFEAATGNIEFKLESLAQPVSCLAYSSDGLVLAGVNWGGTVTLWDLALRKERWKTEAHAGYTIAFHPGSKTIATGGSIMQFIDVESGKRLPPLEGHEEWIEFLQYAPDGKRLLSSSRDGSVRIWEAATGKPLHRFDAKVAWGQSAALSPDGNVAVSCGRDDKIRLWDTRTGLMTREFPLAMNQRCSGIAFSPDGERLLFSGTDLLSIDPVAGKAVKQAREMTDRGTVNTAFGLALTSDGRTMATGHYDKTLRIWNGETFTATRTILGHLGGQGICGFSLAFTPDGRLLAAADGDERVIRLWEAASGKQLMSFEGHENPCPSIALSPDGMWLASGSLDGTARIWELSTGKELLRLLDDKIWKWVGSVAFSPDGLQLATGLNGTILTWSLRPTGPKSKGTPDELWKDLASPEAERAFRAMWALVDGGESAAKLLAEKMMVKAPEDDRIRKLIRALEAEDISDRERASKDLVEAALQSEGVILETLKGQVPPEVRARLTQVLAAIDAPLPESSELLQRLRALQALERLGAVQVIESLKENGPFQRLRREADSALKRLRAK